MTKTKIIFSCQHCAAQFAKWQGQCTECGKWNTIVEETPASFNTHAADATVGYSGSASTLQRLVDVSIAEQHRLKTGMPEFDHVLGGGLVNDSVVLIGGDPGVGKSTLLLQMMSRLAEQVPCLYVTGEESLQQVAIRARRLNLPLAQLLLLAETQVERIIHVAKQHRPQVMVVDSIQTIFTETAQSTPGSVSQVRDSAAYLVRYAKQHQVALMIIGHVTKEGAIAGPRVLEHMVDAVLYFEGGHASRYRIVRAVKNRFGAVNEIGIFAMTDKGLRQVSNPSAIFLAHHQHGVPGSVVMVTWEGSRPLLVEVQALVDESHLANPRRVTVGLEHNRLAMLLAVVHRHAGVVTYNQDVFVNVVGGLHVLETAADLPLLLSVISSLRNKPLPGGLVVFGEVGLSGEIRPVPCGEQRLKEAAKHGFEHAIVPEANLPKRDASFSLKITGVKRLIDVLNIIE